MTLHRTESEIEFDKNIPGVKAAAQSDGQMEKGEDGIDKVHRCNMDIC